MAKLPELKTEDIIAELEDRHREAMLDLVLAWGSLDGSIGALVAHTLGMTPAEGADYVNRMPMGKRFETIRDALKDAPNGGQAADIIRKHKKSYERFSKTRNIITHSHCAGFWRLDPDFVLFAKFELAENNGLAVDQVPVQEMQRATRWGRAMNAVAWKIVDTGNSYSG